MLRHVALALLGWLMLPGCGPTKPECSAPHADFIVLLKFANRPLPADTSVHVTYGGSGMEVYDLADPGTHEVVFCDPADASGRTLDASVQGAAGESAGDSEPVAALSCQLWTAGYCTVQVSGTGLPSTTFALSPREHVCTVDETLLLDPPDASAD